ncbi:hypothetical protein ABT369_29500 [Dactylosporangium sp. NPDC000244]|uniref:hypothetical protein n=1 Tax=Dactylosporangium sp. NPDC000244 TaxID=3154365 RepID=UPI003319A52C
MRAVVVTTADPKRYRRRRLPRGASVRHRDQLVAVQRELAAVHDVTVIVHDWQCATELRRKRKRGPAPDPAARAFSLDQMGMAQKGGAVVSDLRFSRTPLAGANKVAPGECDLCTGCDLLVAADERNLGVADRRRTIAVLSTSRTPSGAMVTDASASFPDVDDLVACTLAPTR